ncbi:MAG: hypothetical protein ACREXX_06260 [Gammaproteobacteria bacterium]
MGRSHRYGDAQIRYHYAKDREVLRRRHRSVRTMSEEAVRVISLAVRRPRSSRRSACWIYLVGVSHECDYPRR